MPLLAALDVGQVAKAVDPALGTLEKSVIGALLVVSWGITLVLIWQLIKVQNARVEDQKVSSAKNEKLVDKMTTAFSEMRNALEGLKHAEESGQQIIQSMKQSFDLFIISQSRRFSPPAGMRAVRMPDEDSRPPGGGGKDR